MPDSPEPVIDVERLAVDLWGNEVLRPVWCRIGSLEELSAALDVVSSDVVAISERERRVLNLLYRDGLTLEQAGAILGRAGGGGVVSRERIRQIKDRTLRKLRDEARWQVVRDAR